MNVEDKQVSVLVELGMTATQAKVYLSLAKSRSLNST